MARLDFEKQKPLRIPWFRRVFDRVPLTQEIVDWHYEGDGTPENPCIVDWIDRDPVNPQNWRTATKWSVMIVLGFSIMAVSFASSSYVGSMNELIVYFDSNDVVVGVGVSLYVLGFGVGPILFAPLSEVYGRQSVMVVTYLIMVVFDIGAIFSKNLQTLFLMRLFAGTFGTSPLTNTGAQIADMFSKEERGLYKHAFVIFLVHPKSEANSRKEGVLTLLSALMLFSTMPLLGPSIGPVARGFLSQAAGWKWVMVLSACFSGLCLIAITLLVPETFAPALLRKRADKLAKMTGKTFISHFDRERGPPKMMEDVKISLIRPWQLLIFEPIVMVLTLYSSVVYGTLYMLFCAFPFVFQEARGWSEGSNGLAFLGLMIGLVIGMFYNIFEQGRYHRLTQRVGNPPAEARLPSMMVGAVVLPIGLFWFAWTTYPSVHFLAPIAGTVLFGLGVVLVFVSIKTYLVDCYVFYSASAVAPTVIVRSVIACAFPLFTPAMFHNLGLQWASSTQPSSPSCACRSRSCSTSTGRRCACDASLRGRCRCSWSERRTRRSKVWMDCLRSWSRRAGGRAGREC